MSCRLTNARITRCALDISQFNIDWRHIRSSDNRIADSISRMYGTGDEKMYIYKPSKSNKFLLAVLRNKIIEYQKADQSIQKWFHENMEYTIADVLDVLVSFKI